MEKTTTSGGAPSSLAQALAALRRQAKDIQSLGWPATLRETNDDATRNLLEHARLIEEQFGVRFPWLPREPARPAGRVVDLADDFADERPPGMGRGSVPTPPAYRVPTREDCHVVLRPNGADQIAGVYRDAVDSNHEGRFTVGVEGDGGRVWPGGQYDPDNPYSIPHEGVDLELVGLTDDASVELGWSTRYGSCARVACFSIGLRGGSDSFVIRGADPVGTVILHDCWWAGGRKTGLYTSGLHVDNYRTLIVNGHRHDPSVLFREHDLYLKSCVDPLGGTWVVNSHLVSGNRTGVQVRPQRLKDDKVTPGNARPVAPIVVARCNMDHLGHAHEGSGGGGAVSVWSSPDEPVFVFGNSARDVRYSALVVEPQSWWKNYESRDDRYSRVSMPIHSAHVWGNDLSATGSRTTAKFSGVGDLWLGDNTVSGRVAFDSGDAYQRANVPNGRVMVEGGGAWLRALLARGEVVTAVGGSSSGDRPMTPAEFGGYFTLA